MPEKYVRMIGGMNEKNTCLRCGSTKSRGRCSSLYCRMMQGRKHDAIVAKRDAYNEVKQQIIAERRTRGLSLDFNNTSVHYEIQQEVDKRLADENGEKE